MSTLYVLKEGEKRGPFTTEELEERVVAGEFCPEDLYWTEDMEDWLPLSGIIEAVPGDSSGDEVLAEDGAEASPILIEPGEEVLFYETDRIRVTSAEVVLNDVIIPVTGITKAVPQIEKLHRFRPIAGTIVLAVVLICLIFLEIPKSTVTHWAIWGVILLGVGLWWVRCLYAAFRAPHSILVIDLSDGDEHIVRLSPEEAARAEEAIGHARAAAEPAPA